jgi:flotillin
MTVISTDGASALTRSVASNVSQALQVSSDLTGIDLPTLLSRLAGASTRAGNGALPPAEQKVPAE